MSSGEADKIMDVASEIAMRIFQTKKREQERQSQESEQDNELIYNEMPNETEHNQSIDDIERDRQSQNEILDVEEDNEMNYGEVNNNERMVSDHINSVPPSEAYEEALVVLENSGLSDNKVEWENEELISNLHKVDPQAQVDFLHLKKINSEHELSLREQSESINNDVSKEKIHEVLESHKEDLNNFIDNEVTNEKENTTNLSKEELEGMLNDHFKKVEAALHNFENKNIDADTFKDKLNSLTNHIKASARSKFHNVKRATVKPVKDLNSYAKNRINQFMNNMNDRLKSMSATLDKKTGNIESKEDQQQETKQNETQYTVHQKGYEQKIEKALNNNPDLLKSVLSYSQVKSMSNHIDSSKERLGKLDNMNVETPEDEQKINDVKQKFQGHINEMESEVKNIEQSYNLEKTSNQLQEATKENENEAQHEQSNDKKETKEPQMER